MCIVCSIQEHIEGIRHTREQFVNIPGTKPPKPPNFVALSESDRANLSEDEILEFEWLFLELGECAKAFGEIYSSSSYLESGPTEKDKKTGLAIEARILEACNRIMPVLKRAMDNGVLVNFYRVITATLVVDNNLHSRGAAAVIASNSGLFEAFSVLASLTPHEYGLDLTG